MQDFTLWAMRTSDDVDHLAMLTVVRAFQLEPNRTMVEMPSTPARATSWLSLPSKQASR